MALSYAVLRNRNFRLLLGTRLAAVFGLQAQAVIVGWQVYTLTHDAFMLGLVGLTEAIPAIVCALFAGHIVDISRPHRVFMIALAGLTTCALGLLLIAGDYVKLPHQHVLAVLFIGVFLSGIARSFIMPASFTLLSQIVPRHDIPAAGAWMTSGFQLAAITGPAIAGMIYGGYGSHIAWFMPVAFLTVSLFAVSAIGRDHRQFRRAVEQREPAVQSIKAGWRFVLHNRVLLPIMALDMFAVLFGGAVAILPAFADQILHTGSEGLGLLRASPAVGSIMTALYFAVNPMKKIRASWLLSVIVGFGVCMICFGLSKSFYAAAFFLAASGAFDSVSMVIRGTLMQLLIPDAMRGRVSALNSMFIISSNEIGAFESGAAASLLGLVPSIVIGGCMTLLVAGFTAVFCTDLRKLVVETEEKKQEA